MSLQLSPTPASVAGQSIAVDMPQSILKRKISLADNTATTFLKLYVPNVNCAGLIKLRLLSAIGAGGSYGAYEGVKATEYVIGFTRIAGTAVVAAGVTVSTPASAVQVAATITSGQTQTLTVAAALASGNAAAGLNEVDFQITIARSGSGAANHIAVYSAELLSSEVGVPTGPYILAA